MKKLIVFAILSMFLFSCVKNSQEYKTLKAENDSLAEMHNKKEAEVESYLVRINDIADNFDKLRAAEQYVNTDASSEKLTKEAVERISENVQLMTDILKKNKAEIAKLEEQLKKSKGSNSQMQRVIDRLNSTLQDRSLAMDSLKIELAMKDEKLFQLGQEVGVLSESNNILSKDNKTKSEKIKKQEELMHTAWYVFGSKRELKSQKIITKNGIFSRTKILQTDFNKDYFVKIDTRSTTTIPLYSKKAKVLTNHPMKSYTITTENGTKVIHIKNFVEFWSVSRYLVVQVN
jgi:chromosome segregation ATPase